MVEIEFSVMESNSGDANKLLPLLEAFEKQYHIHVNLTGIPWEKGWGEIAKFGIYGHGPDVSAIGTSWIGSLAAMQVLRPFTPQQIKALGGAASFFQSSWKTGLMNNDPDTIWAVPWLGDALVLYYWIDALEEAGVKDLQAAFASDDAILETLKTLQKSGIAYPLSINVTNMNILLHEAAHWVWSSGGDFITPDGQKAIFNQPAAMQGWKNYFSLWPFVSPEWLKGASAAGDSFVERKSIIQMGGPYIGINELMNRSGVKDRLGIALAPKVAYVGGASFVMWQYSIRNAEAFELIRFLATQPTRIPASPHSLELPTRRNAIDMLSIEKDIFHRTYLEAMQIGRSFPTMRLWGAIEDKLLVGISGIWTDLLTNPNQDLNECLHKYLDPLAERVNIMLEN